MIKQGDVIKHKRFLNLAYQVFNASEDPRTGNYLLSGMWLNQGQVKTEPLNIFGDIVIRSEHFEDWLKCTKPKSTYIRNEKWEAL